ncbi:MAG: tRNA 2-thiouridine(34) synthase MnmA [Acidimicrobiia bacterium]
MKVLVAMSGGVDSSAAAALMVDEGHEVIGVTLKQWQGESGEMPTAGCCTVGDAEDARRVSAQLGIPYYVLDYMDEFRAAVVEPFGASYAAGLTPNPCVECNRKVRFNALMGRAAELDCDVLVTGHHARVRRGPDGYKLLRAVDSAKDQSYVLHMLGQAELAKLRFPVGEMTKAEVRRVAAQAGLRTAAKPDSQDLCFVGKGDYRDFLRRYFPDAARPGSVVDTSGEVLGEHQGTADFTVGQRRGLGVSLGERRYVVDIRPSAATVVVGREEDLLVDECRVGEVSFVAGHPPADTEVEVKVRYRSQPVPARLERPFSDGEGEQPRELTVRFKGPQGAVAPGQALAFYRGEEVLGGGTILEAMRR